MSLSSVEWVVVFRNQDQVPDVLDATRASLFPERRKREIQVISNNISLGYFFFFESIAFALICLLDKKDCCKFGLFSYVS